MNQAKPKPLIRHSNSPENERKVCVCLIIARDKRQVASGGGEGPKGTVSETATRIDYI